MQDTTITAPQTATMTPLVINRPNWYRGQGGKGSRLVVPGQELQMCCLGFYCRSRGATIEEMEDEAFPSDLRMDTLWRWLVNPLPVNPRNYNSTLKPDPKDAETEIGEINDAPDIDDATRETEIAARFAQVGIAVVFVDEPLY
jgi:hypothetical protein